MSRRINNDTKRLLTGIILPILLGSTGLCIAFFIEPNVTISSEFNGWFKQVIIEAFIPVLIYAVALGGIQSILYSFLMEKLINPKVRSHLLVIFISAILGVISTLLSGFVTQRFVFFFIAGALVGIVVGAILRAMYINEKQFRTML